MMHGGAIRRRLAVDRKQFLILLAAAVMAGSFCLLVLWPRHQELSALGSAVEQERHAVNRKVLTSHEGIYLVARIAGLRKAQDRLAERLPTEPQEAQFLRAIDEQVASEPTVTYEVERAEARSLGQAEAVPLKVRLTGPFDAVYRCLARIEGLERLSQLWSVRMASPALDGRVSAEVEVLACYLPLKGRQQAGAAEAKPAQTGKGRRS